ncbi:MAG: leucine-rich repeat domain-containing protein [Clostridia bacterium]|nr:leucine-rich repeat domain-containing protein [Clostridia bacterium]
MAKKKNTKKETPTDKTLNKATELPKIDDAVVEEIDTVSSSVDIADLKHYFGKRIIKPLENSAILRSRLNLQLESSPYPSCREVANKDTSVVLGVISKIRFEHCWEMANSIDAKKACGNKYFNLTKQEWETNKIKIEKYILNKREERDKKNPVLLEEVYNITEFEYEGIGLIKPSQFSNFLKAVILGQTEENRRLIKTWQKIKDYRYKVPLEEGKGGIFSKNDTKKLRALKITCLNEIVLYSVYELKELLLEKALGNIIQDINTAFKKDLARRRDTAYKVLPFLSAFAVFFSVLTIGYVYQYTVIKNQPITAVIMALLTVGMLDFLLVILFAQRAKKRVKKVPSYKYFTKGVKFSFFILILATVSSVGSTFVYYQRYDGYNEELYYRDVGNNNIAIAGLRNEELEELVIPEKIDGKTVVEIDFYAFRKDGIRSVEMPNTIEVIDKNAFIECEQLEEITISSSLKEVKKGAFVNCANLTTVSFTGNGEIAIGENAFKGCSSLNTIIGSELIQTIGNNAFLGCSNLSEINFSTKLTAIGNSAFENNALKTLVIPESVTQIGEKAFYGCPIEDLSVPVNGHINSISPFVEVFLSPSIFRNSYCDISFTGSGVIPANILKDSTRFIDVKIGEGITGIGESAFENSQIDSVTIANGSNSLDISKKAFYGCSKLNSISSLRSISSIGESCFENCNNLTTLPSLSALTVIPNYAFKNSGISSCAYGASLTTIGVSAFEGCNNLKTVNIPETVTSVGNMAFANCSKLEGITIPCNGSVDFFARICAQTNNSNISLVLSGTGTVPENFLNNATGVKNVAVNNNVTGIGVGAFANAKNLTTVQFSCPIITLPKKAFYGCEKLSTVYGLGGVETIGESCFEKAGSLSTLGFTNALKTISKSAFKDSKISSVNFLQSVTSIGESAFKSCANVSNIDLSNDILQLGNEAFFNCEQLTNVKVPCNDAIGVLSKYFNFDTLSNTATVTFKGNGKIVPKALTDTSMIKAVNIEDGVTEIGESAFESLTGLVSVSLPTSLNTISNKAFLDCYQLKTINLTNVSTIGESSFENCSRLSSANLSTSLTKISNKAFKNAGLTEIYLSSQVKEIGKEAFYGSLLYEVTIPSSVEKIGESAFKECEYLNEITIPFVGTSKDASNKQFSTVFGSTNGNNFVVNYTGSGDIKKEFFSGESNIKELHLGENVLSIEAEALSSMTNLQVVTLPYASTEIPNKLFSGDLKLRAINNFSSVRKIGDEAFKNCTSNSLSLNLSSVNIIGNNAFMNSGLQSINLSAATNLGDACFESCSNLESVTLSSALTVIPESAFNGTSIYLIYIPDSVSTIEDNAFSNCKNLTEINLNHVTSIGKKAFSNTSINTFVANYVKTIGEKAFENTYVSSVLLPKTLEEIAIDAFNNCDYVTAVAIPFIGTSRTTSANYCFDDMFGSSGASSISLTLTDTYKIYTKNFNGSKVIKNLYLTSNLEEIEVSAFKASSITYANFPTTLTSIGASAFEDCLKLYEVDGLENIQDVADATFKNCKELTSTSLISLKTIGEYAFAGCGKYAFTASVEDVTKIGQYAFANSKLRGIALGSALTTIEEGTFSGCTMLTDVNFDTMKVTKICTKAFANTNLKSVADTTVGFKKVKFSNTIVTIESNAFEGVGFTDICFGSAMTNVAVDAFGKNPEFNLYLPTSLQSIYKRIFVTYEKVVIKNEGEFVA